MTYDIQLDSFRYLIEIKIAIDTCPQHIHVFIFADVYRNIYIIPTIV